MIPIVSLNTGAKMPALGYGTWNIRDGAKADSAVRSALDAGYRLIDTAKLYGNERSVGKAVRESGIARTEIFVTTKLWPTDFFNPQKAFDDSMSKLDLEYIDLYLIHWPVPVMPRSVWLAMEKIQQGGKAKAVGVSNYGPRELEKLLSYASIAPAVNQIKFSPFDFEKKTVDYCKEKGIVVEAYSPLTRGHNLDDRTIVEIAARYGKSPAQIMLRWCIEKGTIPLPKSSSPDRMRENMEVFDFKLIPQDIEKLGALS